MSRDLTPVSLNLTVYRRLQVERLGVPDMPEAERRVSSRPARRERPRYRLDILPTTSGSHTLTTRR